MTLYSNPEEEIDVDGQLHPIIHQKRIRIYKNYRVTVFLDNCKYPVVHDICTDLHWKEVDESSNWSLHWYDWAIDPNKLPRMQIYQKINHFPGMEQITRKDTLARNLNRCRKVLPDEFAYYPATFYLPNDQSELKAHYASRKPGQIYISKPVAGCQGRGIKLFTDMDQIKFLEQQVVQQYVSDPYLLDGFKFDLRLYVIVLQVLPYPIIVRYNDGMARLCTTKYQKPNANNIETSTMHLTNYALNKEADGFVAGLSKQGSDIVFEKLQKEGCNIIELQQRIDDIFIKTIFSVLPELQHGYAAARPNSMKFCQQDVFESQELYFGSSCFEILGFDVMIDKNYNPWLFEVNHSPSFTCDADIDLRIKENLIRGVLDFLNITQDDKILAAQHMDDLQLKRLYGNHTQKILQQRKAKEEPAELVHKFKLSKQKSTYSTVLEHYQEILDDNELFTQIYPLQGNKVDKYRQILLNYKNPFMTEQMIAFFSKEIPYNVEQAKKLREGQIAKNAIEKSLKFEKSIMDRNQSDQISSHSQVTKKAESKRPVKSATNYPIKSKIPPKKEIIERETGQVFRLIKDKVSTKPGVVKIAKNSQKGKDDEALEDIKMKLLEQIEYGVRDKKVKFQGASCSHYLTGGVLRSEKVDREVFAELAAKKDVLVALELGRLTMVLARLYDK